jgi:hypothetical protein
MVGDQPIQLPENEKPLGANGGFDHRAGRQPVTSKEKEAMDLVTEQLVMKTYVAEINGEAVMAFRAEDDDDAYCQVNEENGGVQLGLNGFVGVLRADGGVLWDGETPIETRLATQAEHERWQKARDAEIGSAYDGKQIDPDFGDDFDDFCAYLIPVKPVDDEDDFDDEDDEIAA